MKEKVFHEKIIFYDLPSDVDTIIRENQLDKYFLTRHLSSEKKLCFKKSEPAAIIGTGEDN